MSNVTGSLDSKRQDYLQAILKFIPISILQHLSTLSEERNLPECQTLNTVVMVAEIKNFYDQSSRIYNYNSDQLFNEHLCGLSNRFLEIMSKTIHKYGGDIIQFLGNSLIAIWIRDQNQEESKQSKDYDPDVDLAMKATQCALDIKNESQKIISQHTEILMGIGFGSCGILHVGGVFKRVEYFIIGEALSAALRAIRLASSDQSIIISKNLWNMVRQNFVCDLIQDSPDNERSVVHMNGGGIRSKSNTLVLRNLIDENKLKEMQMDLKTYIPAAFRPYLKLKRDTYANEHRKITVMAINIEMSYDINNKQTLSIIQKIVTVVQQQIYRMEGSFNKIISYDSGFSIIATWGISPMSHQDDACRAVLAAFNIQKRINYFTKIMAKLDFEAPIHIGICTGNILMGIVGNEGSRKEIVILGETVERAFLFMQTATNHYGKIYVDIETRKDANQFMDFNYLEHVEFAHKLLNYAIYEPIDPIISYWLEPQYIQKQNEIFKMIRIHQHPFKVDHRNEFHNVYSKIYGSGDIINQIVEDITGYVAYPQETIWALAIKGTLGSGKSLFARKLVELCLTKKKEILKQRNLYLIKEAGEDHPQQLNFHFLASSCNPEIAKRFLGIWQPIIREMFKLYSKKQKKKPEAILNNLIRTSDEMKDKVKIIEEIFGIRDLVKNDQQIVLKEDNFQFVKVQSYPQNIEQDIINFIFRLVQDIIECFTNEIMFLLVLDNVSLIDRASWNLYELIRLESNHLIVVMCIQSLNENDQRKNSFNLKISDHAFNYYQENIADIEQDMFNVVEMDLLNEFDIRQIIIDMAEGYEKEMQSEIILMTQVIEAKTSLKTYHGQQDIKNKLIKQYQVYDYFKETEKEVIVEVVKKCNGNPLLSIAYLYQILTNDYALIREKIFLANNKLRQAYLLLKLASVIGQVFSLKQLKFAFAQDKESNQILQVLLNELELRGLIEVVYEDNQNDVIYRFQQRFLQETLYQLQQFDKQRKQIHEKLISYLQENIIYNWQTGWSLEKEVMILKSQLLDYEQIDSEKDLSSKAKQILTIKKLNILIMQNQKVIKKGYLTQEKQKTKNQSLRYIVLTQRQLIWYENKERYQQNKEIGKIHFDQIVKVTGEQILSQKDEAFNQLNAAKGINEKEETFQIQLQSNEWIKKGELRSKQKSIIYKINSKKRGEDWITHIEYLRNKANFDQFVTKFGKVQFNQQIPNNDIKSSKNKTQTDNKFGTDLQRSIVGSQQQTVILQKISAEKLLFSKKKLKKANPIYKINDTQQIETIETLKNQLGALYNVMSVHFLNHMSINAIQNPVEFDSDQYQIAHIDPELKLKERVVNEVIDESEPEESNIEIQEDSEDQEEIKNEEKDQFIEKQDSKELIDTSLSPIINKDQNQNQRDGIRRFTSLGGESATSFKTLQIGQITRYGFHRMTTFKKTNNFNNLSQDSQIMNEEQIDIDESFHETILNMIEENKAMQKQQKVALPMRLYVFQEGSEICQIRSQKMDINMKQLKQSKNPKTRSHNKMSKSIKRSDVELNEEVYLNNKSSKTIPSINDQQNKQKDVVRHNKAHTIQKVLEQVHKPINLRQEKLPQQDKNNQQDKLKKIYSKNQDQPESKLNESAITSNFSISYIQSVKDDKKSSQKEKSRQIRMKRKKQGLNSSKIYKTTTQLTQFDQLIEKGDPYNDQLRMTSDFKKILELEDDDDCNIDDEDNYSLTNSSPSKFTINQFDRSASKKKSSQVTLTPQQDTFKINEELIITEQNVQCISSQPSATHNIKLDYGHKVKVEKDLKELNLVLCKVHYKDQSYSVFIPRNQLARKNDVSQQTFRSVASFALAQQSGKDDQKNIIKIQSNSSINSKKSSNTQLQQPKNNNNNNTFNPINQLLTDQREMTEESKHPTTQDSHQRLFTLETFNTGSKQNLGNQQAEHTSNDHKFLSVTEIPKSNQPVLKSKERRQRKQNDQKQASPAVTEVVPNFKQQERRIQKLMKLNNMAQQLLENNDDDNQT